MTNLFFFFERKHICAKTQGIQINMAVINPPRAMLPILSNAPIPRMVPVNTSRNIAIINFTIFVSTISLF